jgi:hypothetical protein
VGELVGVDALDGVLGGAFAVGVINGTSGEDPDAGHETRLGAALEHEDLEPPIGVLAAASQQDHGGGRTGRGGRGFDALTLR